MTNNTKSLEGRIKRWLATSPHPNGPLWFEQLTTDLITENARLLAEVERLKNHLVTPTIILDELERKHERS